MTQSKMQPDKQPGTRQAVRSQESLGRVHFIGVGGVGMSAVARIMVARGVTVSGSDAKDLPVMADLAAAGARIAVGYAAANLGDAQTVVAGSAIRPDNPELVAARSAGLPVIHRSEALAATMAEDTVVTVAGTHGKSTTTSMITVLLQGAGLDPSFAIGANVPALGVNAATGSSPVFVAEADESDGSFLNYRPQIAVVTNVEPDHLDYYGTAEAVYASFDRFTALLPADGVLVACADDAGASALARRTIERGNTRVILYGTSPEARIRLHDGGPGDVAITTPAGRFAVELHVPGRHNALNAAAAFAVALELGVDPEVAAGALADFSGASRRFEFKGEGRGVRVYDDYAHHPTEVRAALSAARSVAGGHQVHVLFQPHLFSRTREFAHEFADALNAADTALVLDIYPAREDPIPGVSSQLIADYLGPGGRLVGPGQESVQAVLAAARPGDIVLTAGAGDVTAYGPLIVEALNAEAAECRSHQTQRLTVPSTRRPTLQGRAPGRQPHRRPRSFRRLNPPPRPSQGRRPGQGGNQPAAGQDSRQGRRPEPGQGHSPDGKGRQRRDRGGAQAGHIAVGRPGQCAVLPGAQGQTAETDSPDTVGILVVVMAGIVATAVYSPLLALRTVTVEGTKLLSAGAGPGGPRPASGQAPAADRRGGRCSTSAAAGPGQGGFHPGAPACDAAGPHHGTRSRCLGQAGGHLPTGGRGRHPAQHHHRPRLDPVAGHRRGRRNPAERSLPGHHRSPRGTPRRRTRQAVRCLGEVRGRRRAQTRRRADNRLGKRGGERAQGARARCTPEGTRGSQKSRPDLRCQRAAAPGHPIAADQLPGGSIG